MCVGPDVSDLIIGMRAFGLYCSWQPEEASVGTGDHLRLHVVPTSKDSAACAEQIVLDARQFEVVFARLMLRLPASESMEFGLARCKAAVVALGERHALEARASR